MTLVSLLIKLLGVGAVVVVAQYISAYLSSPLKQLPGPFVAKFSNWWRFFNHYSKTHIETQQALHKKYGNAVRIGPNTVSLSDPSLIKTIYSTRGTFVKDGHIIQNLFSTRSNEFHAKAIKPVQKLYSFTNAFELEPIMDDNVRALVSELESRFVEGANKGKTCDIGEWISYFAWDFLGDMTLSKRMGFMEQAKDVNNLIDTAEKVMRYFSVVGQVPTLDKLLGKNPYLPYKFPDFSHAAGFCVQAFIERAQNMEQFKGKKDYMNGFLKAKEEYPDLVTDNEVIGYLILNILGGADTTAIVSKAIFYHILKHPRVVKILVSELRSSSLPYPASYTTTSTLPYLDACIKEGLRMHPVVGHIFERVVPSTGLTLSSGVSLPPGTIVGVNPWILHRNTDVFGDDAESFRPERWLRGEGEGEGEFEARLKRMKDADLTFGMGNRTCLGRPLGLVEIYKLVATLFRRFEIELEDQNAEWELHKQWFVWPHKIMVKLSPVKSG
ncbi:cytochrome P450 [Dendryphion nanum]|uniref:Cytochrome P450 n=1 Tax=Dendryphion nanum TaxID=256645 RepID=A0A9P9CXD4_9PLEO|nr:cytochrome P450 [Dendryphion nanum]